MHETQHLKGCQGEDGYPQKMKGATGRVSDSTCGRHFKQQEPSMMERMSQDPRSSEFAFTMNIQAEMLLRRLSPEVPDSRGHELV